MTCTATFEKKTGTCDDGVICRVWTEADCRGLRGYGHRLSVTVEGPGMVGITPPTAKCASVAAVTTTGPTP